MLGRTANSIFWMCRYLERAENTARLLDAGFRMSLTRASDAASEEWRSVIVTLGQLEHYDSLYDGYSGPQVCNYVLRDRENPSSVLSMFEMARTNARVARSSLTMEVWEAVNEGWMTLKDILARPVRESNLGTVLSAIRRESTLFRGATYGTMLRNDIYHFARAGTFIERADNTARILDVKYHLLLPSLSYVGSSLDSSQWDQVLRSLAGDRVYSWLNAGQMDPRGIAEFLILDWRFPRSLAFSYEQLRQQLAELALEYGQESDVHVLIGNTAHWLSERTIDSIFETGLHEFLIDFIDRNQAVANAIAEDYRFIA
ncbi:A alpha-helical domain with a conserved ER moti [Croceicoccus estronivorus]|uniref:alpha-E domain-containing protein n=1 Tax=Croceicoccus estronivorus TaxID=1172626 RepID=UPI0008322014|nr:alpha-E domain-containing protein [Croceicoccus estronivorus]OCC25002.1 A alpha-helical domain with a conserved ER moti [Croceicoccus estronivorus]